MKMLSIHRVVSSFILSGRASPRDDDDVLRVAVFRRVDTMPTFPGHWAACSGSVEPVDPSPWHAARRELWEETNLQNVEPNQPGGLYLDVAVVPVRGHNHSSGSTIIRVYPFTVDMPPDHNDGDKNTIATLELRGTEHDQYKFVSVAELEQLEPSVPGLARAFHHATFGRYLNDRCLPPVVKKWAADKENGAAVMAQNALRLVVAEEHPVDPNVLKMLRPSMVSISNALSALQRHNRTLVVVQENNATADTTTTIDQVLHQLQDDARASIEYAVQTIQPWIRDHEQQQPHEPFVIATHSRSSTVLQVLQRLLEDNKSNNNSNNNINNRSSAPLRILCSQSTPGEEGVLIAQDIPGGADCLPDRDLQTALRQGTVHLLLLGCDCLTEHDVVNKVGTQTLVQLARDATKTRVVCCLDRWKVWDDIYPPPLEDIFECVPRASFDFILLPPVASNKPR